MTAIKIVLPIFIFGWQGAHLTFHVTQRSAADKICRFKKLKNNAFYR